MDKLKISVKEAIELIKNNKFSTDIEIDFTNVKIDAFDTVLLGKNGIDVPEELIKYDDTKIDYSDIAAITDEDITSGKIKWTVNAEIPLEKEITDWIEKENINLNEFTAKLIRNFYEGIKSLLKNAAL